MSTARTTKDAASFAGNLSLGLVCWALCLAVLPAGMGVLFIALDLYPAYRGMLGWFVGPWAAFGIATILIAMPRGFSPVRSLISSSSLANAALIILLALIARSLIVDATGDTWKPVRSMLLLSAMMVGTAACFLARHEGPALPKAIVAAFIVAPFLHLPVLAWLVALEAQNADLRWHHSIPGFPWVRTWNYLLEVAIALGLGLYAGLGWRQPRALVLGALGLTILWATLFWGGGRGATLGLAGALVLVSVIWPARVIRLWLTAAVTAGFGAALSLLVWTPPSGSFGLIPGIQRSLGANPTSSRTQLWQEWFAKSLDKPVMGHGFAEPMPWLHFHNLPLDALHSFGFLGLACVAVLIFHVLRPLLAARRHLRTPLAQAMLLALAALLVHGLVAGTYFHVHSQIWIALLLGGLVSLATPGASASVATGPVAADQPPPRTGMPGAGAATSSPAAADD